MTETQSNESLETLGIKVEVPDITIENPDIKIEDPDIKEEQNHKAVNVSKNGDSSSEVRSRRSRKSPAYNIDTLYSDSDPQSDGDVDPEFVPSATPPHSTGTIPKDLQVTGYALFCNDNRATVEKQFPDMPINKISMKLSHMWSSLPAGTKRSYSCRARHLRPDGNTKKMKRESKKEKPPEEDLESVVAFCCLWGRCDFQFEMVDECAQHISDDHLRLLCLHDSEILKAPASCCWRGCLRQKRCSLPFVQYERLMRHMSEEHVLVGKPLRAMERSVNFLSRRAV